MRAGTHYRCPECGESCPTGVSCFRCDVMPVDENGNRRPPVAQEELSALGGPGGMGSRSEALFALAELGGAGFHALAREVRELNTRRRARRSLKAPIEEAAKAAGPTAHIRGKVKVLEAVRTPEGDDVAAYLWRRSDHARRETRTGCGKLLIEDETGVALLDDDFFVLLPPPGRHPLARSDLDMMVLEGDTVEVAGPATRRAAPELSTLLDGGYRATPNVLVFDGTSDDLLTIRPE